VREWRFRLEGRVEPEPAARSVSSDDPPAPRVPRSDRTFVFVPNEDWSETTVYVRCDDSTRRAPPLRAFEPSRRERRNPGVDRRPRARATRAEVLFCAFVLVPPTFSRDPLSGLWAEPAARRVGRHLCCVLSIGHRLLGRGCNVMAHRLELLLALTAALIGCSREPSADSQSRAGAASVAPSASAGGFPSVASAATPEGAAGAATASSASPLSESSARALVESWSAAQNQGDFAAYERVYAARFTGVKRSGDRTRQLGRDAWMADRAKMFQRPMKVIVESLEVDVSASLARVRFEQTWSSGTYRDKGPKELILIADAGGLHIAREEMIESIIDKDAPLRSALSLRMVDAGFLVLSDSVGAELGVGPARASPSAEPNVQEVLRDVDPSRVPASAQRLVGVPLQAVDAEGQVCATKVTKIEIRARVIPHFSFGRDVDGNDAHWSEAKLHEEIWALTENGGREIVGALDPPCRGSLWAIDPDDPLPKVYTPGAANGALKAAAMQAFEHLPEYAVLQRQFREASPGARGAWTRAEPSRVELRTFQREARPAVLIMSVSAGEGCSSFSGSLTAAFEVGPGPSPKLTTLGALEAAADNAVSAFDLDGDGQLEFLNLPLGTLGPIRQLLYRDGKQLRSLSLLDVVDLDCPC
jgi:ketosteroid isomerase-like protein